MLTFFAREFDQLFFIIISLHGFYNSRNFIHINSQHILIRRMH